MNRPSPARGRFVTVACLLVAAAMAVGLAIWLRQRPSAEEQLRALDAAHAIPDEENAAKDYTKLIWGDVASSFIPQPLSEHVRAATCTLPWRSTDYPEAVQWLQDHQAVIDALLAASRKPQCWFSATEGRWHVWTHPRTVYQWPRLLVQAAHYDLGEGRTEAGLEKLLSVLRMANHFLSQDHPWYYSEGMGMAKDGLNAWNRLVVLEDVPADWLARFEATLPSTKDTWAEKVRQLEEVADLYQREVKQGIAQRLARPWLRAGELRMMRVFYLLHLSECRASRILLALRRHKDRTGAWPVSLAQIQPQVSPEVILDPFSGRPFGYRLGGETFLLYSVGPNGTDEGGTPKDDRILWSH